MINENNYMRSENKRKRERERERERKVFKKK